LIIISCCCSPAPGDYEVPLTVEDAAQGSGEEEEDGGLPTYRVTTEAATATEAPPADNYAVTGSEDAAAASEDKTADSGVEEVATTEAGAEAPPSAGYDVNTVPTSEEKPVKQGTQKPSPSPTKTPGAKNPSAKNPTAAPASPVSAAPPVASGPVTDYTLPQENKKPGAPLKAAGKAKAADLPASTAAPAATAEAPLPKSGSLEPKDATEEASLEAAAEEEEEVKEEEEKEEEEEEKEKEEEKEAAAGEGEEGARKCPGGSLAACVKVCPGTSGRLYGACVAGCGDRCPE
jgi:hypothetical protein